MNFKERFLTAMHHEEPDRVPVMGLIMDPSTVNQIMGKEPVDFVAMIKNPDLVDRVNEIALNFNLGYFKNCIELGVDYIYETIAEEASATSESSGLSGQDLRSEIVHLPRKFAEELEAAIELSDMERMDQLVVDISVDHEPLANGLKELVDTFQYDRILALLENR